MCIAHPDPRMQTLLLFLFSVAIEPIENKETDNVIKSTIDDKTEGDSLIMSIIIINDDIIIFVHECSFFY